MHYKEMQLAQNRNRLKMVPSNPLWGGCRGRKIRTSVIPPCHFKLATCITFIDLLFRCHRPPLVQTKSHSSREWGLTKKEPPKKWISHRNLQKATTGRKNLIKYKGKIHCKKVKWELQDSETARWLLVYKTRQVWRSCCWLDSRLISSEVINILMHIWEGRFFFFFKLF